MFVRLLLIFRFLTKQNIFLGIILTLRKFIVSRETYKNNALLSSTYRFTIDPKAVDLYFENRVEYKDILFKQADKFVSGSTHIYQKEIQLSEYSVNRYLEKRKGSLLQDKDIRFYWEIYRSKYLFNVGMAYYLSKDKKYAESLIDHIDHWKDYCPLNHKNVPFNGMEAALKIFNLSWIEFFLADYDKYNEDIRPKLFDIIIQLAEYIYKNYEFTNYGLESNHGITCNFGLIYASVFLSNYKRSYKWYRFGMHNLKRNLKTQFSKDGVNFESSVNYHRFVFEMLVFLKYALKKNGKALSKSMDEAINRISSSLGKLTHANGNISRFGDNDGGKFLFDFGSVEEFNSLQYLNWFSDKSKLNYETLILDDSENHSNYNYKSNIESNTAGNYFSYKGADFSLISSANIIGTKGKGNHQHNDFLAFELFGYYPFIVDPWSFCYTGSKELRNQDRRTASHNNILIDSRDIVVFDNNRLFEMLGNVKVKIDKIEETKEYLLAYLCHNGYKDLKKGKQLHSRRFNINKTENTITITDELKGFGNHTAELNFHIPKAYWNLKIDDSDFVFHNNKEEFTLSWNKLTPIISDGKISENFLNRSDSYHLNISKEYSDSITIETNIKYNKLK